VQGDGERVDARRADGRGPASSLAAHELRRQGSARVCVIGDLLERFVVVAPSSVDPGPRTSTVGWDSRTSDEPPNGRSQRACRLSSVPSALPPASAGVRRTDCAAPHPRTSTPNVRFRSSAQGRQILEGRGASSRGRAHPHDGESAALLEEGGRTSRTPRLFAGAAPPSEGANGLARASGQPRPGQRRTGCERS
jgi:hypothetical protein